MHTFLLISFIAGVLTVLAPCVLPLLPVIIGSSVSGRSKATPYTVVGSLAVSIIFFTYVLKFSTAFISVPQEVWAYISGGILIIFGLTLVFPALWANIPGMAILSGDSNKLVGVGYKRKGFVGDVIIGMALGPVFSTCSPTYFVILASVLPASFFLGTVYLLSYTIGLSVVLLLVAILGERFASKLSTLSDPDSWLKKCLGILFILLGLMIATGYEKKLEAAILNSGFFDITKIEQKLLKDRQNSQIVQNIATTDELTDFQNSVPDISGDKTTTPAIKNQPRDSKKTSGPVVANQYKEIVNPSGFVNSEPFTLGSLVGKKVILIDFLTYSCINCQRTFPYLDAWYDKYKNQGLEIVGIHTPEFAFEKDINNVREAMKKFGITHPVVLDNDYGTWNAYGNLYWPRKYLIDIYGNIVFDVVGEGQYAETEAKIQELLAQRTKVLGMAENMPKSGDALVSKNIPDQSVQASSPETYFGAQRNGLLANGISGSVGQQKFYLPSDFKNDALYLGGTWNFKNEYAESVSDASIIYKYNAKEVYIVAESDASAEIEVIQDGKLVTDVSGQDVQSGSLLKIEESRLYKVIKNATRGDHTLELKVKSGKVRMYTFTFG